MTPELYDDALSDFRGVMGDGLRLRLGRRARALDDALLAAMVDVTVDRVGRPGLLALFRQFAATAELDLSVVPVPTLVLAGETDHALAGERALALSRAMPSARVRRRAHYGHFCHIEQADDVAAELTAFLDPVTSERMPRASVHP